MVFWDKTLFYIIKWYYHFMYFMRIENYVTPITKIKEKFDDDNE